MLKEEVLTMILKNGNSTGIIECNLDEWYISYKIPRNKLKEALKLKYINNTGVYILFGDDEKTLKKAAYIGSAEDIVKRLQQHNKEKDFWNECIVFVSENNSLNTAHIGYIEHEIYKKSTEVNRYIVKMNRNTPPKPSLGKVDEIKANKFIEKIKIITSIFGYRIFDELINKNENLSEENTNILYLQYKGETIGKAIETDEGFVILKGSKITNDIKPSVKPALEKFIIRERNSEDIKNGIFINNHLTNSPSMAGVILLGMNVNGKTAWKNKNGKTLKEIQEENT